MSNLLKDNEVRLNRDGQAVTRPIWDEEFEGWPLLAPTQIRAGLDEGNRLVIVEEVTLSPEIDLTAAQAEWNGYPSIGFLGFEFGATEADLTRIGESGRPVLTG